VDILAIYITKNNKTGWLVGIHPVMFVSRQMSYSLPLPLGMQLLLLLHVLKQLLNQFSQPPEAEHSSQLPTSCNQTRLDVSQPTRIGFV